MNEGYLDVLEIQPVDISQEQQSKLNEYIESYTNIVAKSTELITFFLNYPVSYKS